MLKDILTKAEKIALLPKYNRALLGLSGLVNKIHKKKQHPYVKNFKDAGFSLIDCKDLGFEFGKGLWSNCDDTSNRNLGI